MDLPVIYLIIILAYLLLLFSFMLRNYMMMMLTSFFMFAIALHTIQNGIGTFTQDTLIVIMFSAITFAIAAYVSMKSTLDIIEENY